MSERQRRDVLKLVGGVAVTASLAGCGADEPAGDTDDTDAGDDDTDDTDDSDLIDVADDAAVFFETPTDGTTAANGLTVSMIAENFDLVEAGTTEDNAGHFHININEGAVETGEVVPLEDDNYIHYGDASSRDVLDLPEGTHELTLQPGDGQHRALPLTDTVEVTVEDASIAFDAPADGATVSSPVEFEFGTSESLSTEPAGTSLADTDQTAGHFHVIVDDGPVDTGEVIPLEDDNYLHFGDGATSAEVDLPAGTHELTLQMGDPQHLALPETDTIELTVEDPDADDEAEEADATVTVAPDGAFGFDPEELTVDAGDTVEFVWGGGGHNINVLEQPADGNWEGVESLQGEGFSHTHTFEAAGQYDYRCDPHRSSMQGTVVVEDD
ncbi:MAG: DUF4399 domain-containing protein [Natronomonas sp.]